MSGLENFDVINPSYSNGTRTGSARIRSLKVDRYTSSSIDLIKTRNYIDVDRLGVFGVSYGGYLTNWIVTQTDRFKAAVPISSMRKIFKFSLPAITVTCF